MSIITFYSVPDSMAFLNPKLEFIKTLILYGESLYWNSGGGQATIKYEENGVEKILAIMFAEKFGFYLIYDIPKESKLIAIGEGDFDEIVTINIGGNREKYPSKFFISRDDAWEAVECFCETGEPSEEISWEKQEDLDWDFNQLGI
jgi:hypothetical protein